jgi:hypothetical protein
MWLSIRDEAGNILGQEDLIHTSWIVTEQGFENTDLITIVVVRTGTIAKGEIHYDDGTLAATVDVQPGELRQGEEIDFQAGTLIIFGSHVVHP